MDVIGYLRPLEPTNLATLISIYTINRRKLFYLRGLSRKRENLVIATLLRAYRRELDLVSHIAGCLA